MKTILTILQEAGSWRPNLYLKIEHPPYMELVIMAPDWSGAALSLRPPRELRRENPLRFLLALIPLGTGPRSPTARRRVKFLLFASFPLTASGAARRE